MEGWELVDWRPCYRRPREMCKAMDEGHSAVRWEQQRCLHYEPCWAEDEVAQGLVAILEELAASHEPYLDGTDNQAEDRAGIRWEAGNTVGAECG